MTGFRSKLHIESYKIINFKDVKEPEIVNTLMKLMGTISLCFRDFLALVAAHKSSCKKIRWKIWLVGVVSGMFTLGGWPGMKRHAKVQNSVGYK